MDDPPYGAHSARDDHDRWWRRHPGPTRPTLPLPDDPFLDDSSSDAAP